MDMAEPITEPAVETEEAPDEGKGLRAQLESALSENKKLKTEKLAGSFEDLRLDPSTGLGKAIAKEYDGETSTEALAAYAKEEYGYEVEGVSTSENPVAPAVQQGHERLDEINQSSGSVPVPTQQSEIAQAEAEGDWQKAMSLKAAQVEQGMRP